MGSWKLAAVALTRSRLEESLDYGRMTRRCRLVCRLVCPNNRSYCHQQPTALRPLTTVCFFCLHKSRSKDKCAVLIELPRPFSHARQGVYRITILNVHVGPAYPNICYLYGHCMLLSFFICSNVLKRVGIDNDARNR